MTFSYELGGALPAFCQKSPCKIFPGDRWSAIGNLAKKGQGEPRAEICHRMLEAPEHGDEQFMGPSRNCHTRRCKRAVAPAMLFPDL
jgi:hypothetical protein